MWYTLEISELKPFEMSEVMKWSGEESSKRFAVQCNRFRTWPMPTCNVLSTGRQYSMLNASQF